jgi:hypothetical protein
MSRLTIIIAESLNKVPTLIKVQTPLCINGYTDCFT